MRRREFIAATSVATAFAAIPGRAQQSPMPVIGYMSTIVSLPSSLDELRRGLAEAGFVEGRNVRIEYRTAEGHYERLPASAAELVRLPVDVIVAGGGSVSGLAAKTATDKISIVVISGDDPVKLGLAESLARPGRNVTGVSQLVVESDAKRLQLLHELVPDAGRIGHRVTNPMRSPNGKPMNSRRRGVRLESSSVSSEPAIARN